MEPVSRNYPPNRRMSTTHRLDVEECRFFVTIGYTNEGEPCEVFICGPKVGSPMARLCDDSAVVLSLALQYGVPHAQLLHSLYAGRVDGSASLLGTIIELLHE